MRQKLSLHGPANSHLTNTVIDSLTVQRSGKAESPAAPRVARVPRAREGTRPSARSDSTGSRPPVMQHECAEGRGVLTYDVHVLRSDPGRAGYGRGACAWWPRGRGRGAWPPRNLPLHPQLRLELGPGTAARPAPVPAAASAERKRPAQTGSELVFRMSPLSDSNRRPTHYKSRRDLAGWFRALTWCPEPPGQDRFVVGCGPRQDGSCRTVRSRIAHAEGPADQHVRSGLHRACH